MPATIRRGSQGNDVRQWQSIIGVSADGKFGPATETATKAWQKAHGLTADGIVGPKSWQKASEVIQTNPSPQQQVSVPAVVAAAAQAAPQIVQAAQNAAQTAGVVMTPLGPMPVGPSAVVSRPAAQPVAQTYQAAPQAVQPRNSVQQILQARVPARLVDQQTQTQQTQFPSGTVSFPTGTGQIVLSSQSVPATPAAPTPATKPTGWQGLPPALRVGIIGGGAAAAIFVLYKLLAPKPQYGRYSQYRLHDEYDSDSRSGREPRRQQNEYRSIVR
jgi:peptidoglycan hydrolase-like protein with peptidoglycan-binding domain